MVWKAIAFSLLSLSVDGAACAREVELMHFDGAAVQDVVIHVGPSRVQANMPPVTPTPDLSAALSADFAQIGAPAIADPLAPTSVINVPDWIRSGIAMLRLAPMVTLPPPLRAGCGDARYRPRIDLAMSMELQPARLFPLIVAITCEHQIPVGLFDALIGRKADIRLTHAPQGGDQFDAVNAEHC